MTLAELQTLANAKLADFWALLTAKEDAYFAKHGKYFQLLISPETSVVDGVLTDWTLRTPSDEVFVVDVDVPWSEKLPFQLSVHEWVGDGDDRGYQARVVAELPDGRRYARHRDSNAVDSGWFQVPVIED